MSARHRKRHPETVPVKTKPAAADRTVKFPAVTLLADKDPVTETFPRPAFNPGPAPAHGPATVPALRPTLPAHPRGAWVPAPPHVNTRPPVRITEGAVLAGMVAAAWPGLFTLPCHTCHRVSVHGGTASFRALHAEAWRAGWRVDTFGEWACPSCQAKPGWRAPNTPALAGEHEELLRDVASQATDVPVLDTFRQVLRRPRYLISTSALEAVTAK